jgi:membrane protein implicated in regulation of membrane protease activity
VLGWTMSWISPLLIASAALWFGAGGLITDLAVPALSGPVAVAAAVVGALVVRMLVAAFARADSEPLYADATGAVGVLNAAIRPDGVGEVIYVLEGLHRTAAAKSLDGTSLPRGTNVVIVRRERGVAYVSPLDPLSPLENGGLANVPPDNPVSRQVEP